MSASTRRLALNDITPPSNTYWRMHSNEIPASFLTPSPDEEIIRRRGRKPRVQMQTTIETNVPSSTPTQTRGTPPKTPSPPGVLSRPNRAFVLDQPIASPSRRVLAFPMRCSPRKKLRLSSPNSKLSFSFVSESNQRQTSLAQTKLTLSSLTANQLVELFNNVMTMHPDILEEVNDLMPKPDLTPIEQRLSYLKQTIFKSIPDNRLMESKRSAVCFNRVKIHVNEFKKECVNQGKLLVESHQWESVLEYVLMAWELVNQLPKWDVADHNKPKEMCFKALTAQCHAALKKLDLDKHRIAYLYQKFREMAVHSSELECCVKLAEEMGSKLNQD